MFLQEEHQEEHSECDYSEVRTGPTDEKFLFWLSGQRTVSDLRCRNLNLFYIVPSSSSPPLSYSLFPLLSTFQKTN